MRNSGPVFDPNRPRHLSRAQAETRLGTATSWSKDSRSLPPDALFYTVIGDWLVRGVEALFNEAADAKRDGYRLPPNDIGYRGRGKR